MKKILLRSLLAAAIGAGMIASAQAEMVHVLMKTNKGDIELELDGDKAPKSVANFLRYVDEGYYSGTIFHRVINGFMIQGGGFTPEMTKKATHEPIENEAKNERGTIAMARTSDPQSATSQFYINHKDNAALDYPSRDGWGYAVFGKVVRGMETVDAIAGAPTGVSGGMRDVPKETVTIESVTRVPAK